MGQGEQGRILLTVDSGVASLTIDRPERLNALNNHLRAELFAAIGEVEADQNIRVLVLRGAGGRAFVAGADVEELIDLSPSESVTLSDFIAETHDRLAALPIPVIAGIQGWCLGGGLELAMAADLRLASEKSRFGLPEIKLGILPGGGGIARLARLAPAAAAYLCFTGAIIPASRALELGLVMEVVAEDAFEARITELAAQLATSDRATLAAMKAALALPASLDVPEATRREGRIGAALYGTETQRRLMSEFLAQRSRKSVK